MKKMAQLTADRCTVVRVVHTTDLRHF